MCAAENAPRGPFCLLERRHGLAEIIERRAVVSVERLRVNPWFLKVGAVVLVALVLTRRRASRRGRSPLPRARVERRASSASPMRTESTGRIRRRVSSDQALPNAYD